MRLVLSPSPDAEALFFLSASTVDAIMHSFLCRNLSIVARQEVILWGKVPPITVSLDPIVSRITPTSPIAPH